MNYALDTNVLLRYIMQDDETQSRQAAHIIESFSHNQPAFISCIVLCEVNWVLKTSYRLDKEKRIAILRKIMTVSAFDIEKIESCLKSLDNYEQGQADFPDYMVQEIASIHGYNMVFSFDKKALKNIGFIHPEKSAA